MEFRKAIESDANSIMNIIKQAQASLKENGVDQWQDNYPNLTTIMNDIKSQNGYVLLIDNKLVGTVAVSFDGETTYESIFEGEWISNDKYAVIHRIAVDVSYKELGVATRIINNIQKLTIDKGIQSIKVDTHEDNLSMQKLLNKNKFKYCGIIYLEDKSKRLAFEKIL
jgi:ribosomal protein S18 acetylase RimI-like enzyme